MTWNNYTDEDIVQAERVLGACAKYIFGKEIGKQGTPHLQGAVRFKQKTRFTAVTKLFPDKGVHWEKMVRTWKINVAYCVKEMNGDWSKLYGNIPEASRLKPYEKVVMETQYKDVVWREWQQEVIDIVRGPVHARKIYWFWEPTGNSGKSFLVKWLFLNYRCIVAGGKKADVFHQVFKHFEENQDAPTLILLDVPRSSQKWVNYGALEDLKNGFVSASKYEGGRFAFMPPHVVCFANEEPEYEEMSYDRWCVRRLTQRRTVAQALGAVSDKLIV